MKRLLIFCLSIFAIISCKNDDVDSDLTAKYVGIWEAPLATANTDHIWTIEKTGNNQIKISILEHTEFNVEGYESETNKTYTVDKVGISNDKDPTFHFDKAIDDLAYGIDVSLSISQGKLFANCKTTQKGTGQTHGSPNLEFTKK
ncbi:hypothetical protein [Dyadobacter alkalitolerans]|uniref:hypothetical protein n=1 Tax=Dyadobacter alkalitolerans TaxID=492736 RepID=UPI00040101D0|nr:hypothetical protein [Dyadobacter alkalitolerans]